MSGIVGIVSGKDCLDDLFYATDYHSHLGTEYGGLAITDGERLVRRVHSIKKAQFKARFFQDIDFQTFKGNKGIGVISDRDFQPLIPTLRFGEYAMVGSGYIYNQDELARRLIGEGVVFSETRNGGVNQIELAAKLINKGNDLVDGINYMNNQIEGSMSLILLGREGIYAARAKYGHTPLVLGEKEEEGNKSRVVAFETTSYKNLGFFTKRFLGPNEIIFLDAEKEKQLQKPNNELQLCTFLFVYTGFPTSEYEGKNVTAYREASGRIMAKRDDVELDWISGVADSGSIYADGYANESHVPIAPVTSKYGPGWQRSYTPPSQRIRDLIATMKQVSSEELIREKRLGITEDSIVRGTQLMNFYLVKLWKAGAKEIHIRPACPALMWPCKNRFATRTKEELFARKILKEMHGRWLEDNELGAYLDVNSQQYGEMIGAMEKHMKEISLSHAGLSPEGRRLSLRYQTLENTLASTGLPKEKLCTSCWDGCDPTKCKTK